MPIIENTSYAGAPFYQFNKHLQSVLPAFRQVHGVDYTRERIELPDGDFLDLDWQTQNSPKLVVLTHGLEGNSGRPYILGAAKLFFEHGWDVLAWNCRSCSGEMNRLFRLYNHGDTDDIAFVVNHAFQKNKYDHIALVGHSMGGNISLKYAATKAHPSVKSVVAFSAPLDMASSTATLGERDNWIYRKHFEKKLLPKLEAKARLFPERLDIQDVKRNLYNFNFQLQTFFCTINGYPSLEDFYKNGSALNFIPHVKIPALIVQAQNDPMLSPECFPYNLAKNHDFIHLETPAQGGHCGFMDKKNPRQAWCETRALAFSSS